jgi:excisionase family DNA binding protein
MPRTGDDSMKDLASKLRALAAEMLQVADALDKGASPDTAPLRVPEVARKLRLSPSTVQRWCRLGRLGKLVGRDYLISPDELAAYVASRRAQRKRGG